MKPSILKGTRDFLPAEVLKRNYMFDTIESVFIKYGYVPIETPTMENLQTLLGKYGNEGDKLLFKVLNNGDFLAKADEERLKAKDSNGVVSQISKRGLRYDLTVPMARYVVMHQNELSFPFKRYQIQPVWRADRPQKGRYQEFYQCDIDILGSDALMYEAELVQIYDEVFAALNLDVTIKVNNRKILSAIAAYAGVEDQMVAMTVAIDKLDKVGWEGVQNEMSKSGFSDESIEKITSILQSEDESHFRETLMTTEIGRKGFEELDEMMDYLSLVEIKNKLDIDFTLARGLDYYTGCIFEVVSNEVKMGSIGGGGRYDDLTSIFGLKNVSGVGVSFGADRIYDVLLELDKFPKDIANTVKAIVVVLDQHNHTFGYKICNQLRQEGISADIYPSAEKLKKQMKYANDRNIPFVILLGDDEVKSNQVTVKNMGSGDQKRVDLGELAQFLLNQ